MALRTMWRGVLQVSIFKAHVSIKKATEEYRGKSALHELCECHQEPFTRRQVCTGGKFRLTEEMTRKQETENTTGVVKGVEQPDDSYVVLERDALSAIEEAGTSSVMSVDAVVALDRVPRERGNGLFYITPDSKVKESAQAVEVLCAVLKRDETAVITTWAPRGRHRLVAIYPKGEQLVMQTIMYDAEIRPPDEPCTIGSEGVTDAEIEVAGLLLGKRPNEYDFAAAQDNTVLAREEAIDAARNGEPIPTHEPTAEPTTAPDLMAALQAALDAEPAAKDTRNKASTSNGAVPVGTAS
jgi:DNA end-binding protein Ku